MRGCAPSSSWTTTTASAIARGGCSRPRAGRSSGEACDASRPCARPRSSSPTSCSSTCTCPTSAACTSRRRLSGDAAVVLTSSRDASDFADRLSGSGALRVRPQGRAVGRRAGRAVALSVAAGGEWRRGMDATETTEQAVARTLAEAADLRSAYPRVLRLMAEGLGWALAAAWEPGPDGAAPLRCVASWWDDPTYDRFEGVTCSLALAPGEGLPGRVLGDRPAGLDRRRHPTTRTSRAREAAKTAGLHAAFCFPVRSARGVVGGGRVASTRPAARARRGAAGTLDRPRRPDRAQRRAPAGRGGRAHGERRNRAMLDGRARRRDHDRPRRPHRRVQPRRRAHLRLRGRAP